MSATLYYIHDPMCSWCWGYRPTWDALKSHLPDSVTVENVAGGLAPDTDQPMPMEMREAIQGYWRNVQAALGTEMNYEFWEKNTPRRSTYPACRAVIAAKNQGLEDEMINEVQKAYYLRALNPSDTDILLRLAWDIYAQELPMDIDQFAMDLSSAATEHELQRQIQLARELPNDGFPSLVLEKDGVRTPITRDYKNYETSLAEIKQLVD